MKPLHLKYKLYHCSSQNFYTVMIEKHQFIGESDGIRGLCFVDSEQAKNREVLFPCGNLCRDVLCETLKAHSQYKSIPHLFLYYSNVYSLHICYLEFSEKFLIPVYPNYS